MKRISILLLSLFILFSPALTQAANIPNNSNLPTWDWNYQRTASAISSSTKDPWTNPDFLSYVGQNYIYDFELPTGQLAMVDPVYDSGDNTVYQVTYDLSGNANIWAYTLPASKIAPKATPVKLTAGANDVLNLGPADYGSGSNIQAPEGLSISPDGKWMALGLGNYLFWWPLNGMTQVPASSVQRAKITTDPSAVASSPLFTPDSRYIMIGDHEGGFVSADTSGNILPENFSVRLPDVSHGGTPAGAAPFTSGSPGDAITSTPSWDPGTPSGSDADAWFGVADLDGTGHNRLIQFNPYANGGYGQIDNDNIGLGTIAGPVWSPVAVDPTTGDVFNTDYTGALYWWNAAGIHRNTWTNNGTNGTVISNLSILPTNGNNVDGTSDEDLVSWVDDLGILENAVAHTDGSTGTPQNALTELAGIYEQATGPNKTLDPRFIGGTSPQTGFSVGQGFEDNSTGMIYYSASPLSFSQSHSLTPMFTVVDAQNVSGYTAADFDLAIPGTDAASTYMAQMPDPNQLQVISTWTNRDINGYPAIVWYLPAQRSLTLTAKNSNGGIATSNPPSQSAPYPTLSGAAGGQISLTSKYFGGLVNEGNSEVQVNLTVPSGVSFPNSKTLPYSSNNDPNAPAAYTYTVTYGNSGVSLPALPPPPAGQSSYTIQATAELEIGGVPVSGVSSGPIDITVDATNTNVGTVSGPLTLSSYHDNNLNNAGKDKAGFNNVETGDPLHAYYGDTMLADLVIKVPPLPGSNWRYDSATLRATINYPDCEPVGWGADVDGPHGNQTTCTERTTSFSVNTRAGTQENHSSVNDSIATFPVWWPTWRPPTGIIHHTWEGALTATWTQTYTLQHYEIIGTDSNGNPIWGWVTYGPYYQNGTSPSQDVKVTKTDIYYPMVGTVWEPWMK